MLNGRGRNGWFKVKRIILLKIVNGVGYESEDSLSIEIESSHHGNMAPIVIEGDRTEIKETLEVILTAIKLNRFGQSLVIEKGESKND
jgi:hypothetical protein